MRCNGWRPVETHRTAPQARRSRRATDRADIMHSHTRSTIDCCSVAVYGASGHTGGFILDELARRGVAAVAVGRHPGAVRGGLEIRVASIDDPAALERAFSGSGVVINAAGPFLDTAAPVIEAALAVGSHVVDVTAEQESARATLDRFDAPARARGLTVIPAAGFYGGLADLIASALAGRDPIDAIRVAVALDRWWPTAGTRRTGERNTFARRVVDDGRLVAMSAHEPGRHWDFGPPHGIEAVEPVPLSEVVTIAHHLRVGHLRSYLGVAALRDLRDPRTTPPPVVDAHGRSSQHFTMQVELDDARGRRRATASGRDIYAVTAPLVVEAAQRLLSGESTRVGAITLGAAFDPCDMLDVLASTHFDLRFETVAGIAAGVGRALHR